MVRCRIVLIASCVLVLVATFAVAAEPPTKPAVQPNQEQKQSQDQSQEQSQEQSQDQKYLRLTQDSDDVPLALEVAIVRFTTGDQGEKGPTVDLIGAVHVGEEAYYDLLNREFRSYDVVLYELVAPEGTQIPKGGARSASPVSMLQRGMKNMLELRFQLEEIDYTRENMVRADMTPDQFRKSMSRRGESVFKMFVRMMGFSMSQQGRSANAPSDMQLLLALFDKNRSLSLKRIMAKQFQDMDGMLSAVSGSDGSTIITERNKVALKGLRKQLDAGKKRIAIFYGAGHMTDMQQRLNDDFDLVPASARWIVAWDLRADVEPGDGVAEDGVAEDGALGEGAEVPKDREEDSPEKPATEKPTTEKPSKTKATAVAAIAS